MLSNYTSAISDLAYSQSLNTATVFNNVTKNILNTFDDLDNCLSDAPSLFILKDLEIAIPQKSTYNKANQVEYKKFFQREKAAAIKTNTFVLFNSPHFKANCILFDYALNYSEKQSTRDFICIA